MLWIVSDRISAGRPVLHVTDCYGEQTEQINITANTSAQMKAFSFRNRPHTTVTPTEEI